MKLYAVIGVSNIDGDLHKNLKVCGSYTRAKKIFDDWVEQDEEVYADSIEKFKVEKTKHSYMAYEPENPAETCVWIEIEEVLIPDGEAQVIRGGMLVNKNDNLRRI